MAKGSMPVLVGVGQSVSHWTPEKGVETAPSPLSMARAAAQAALADCGAAGNQAVADAIDALVFVRIFEDSVPRSSHANTNLPGTLARDLGADPRLAIYSSVGGQSPQALVHEMAGRIHEGEFDGALLVGSEAIGASKAARRAGLTLDWADGDDRPMEDRGLGDMLLDTSEIRHGLVAPPYYYALFETAIAARDGRRRDAQRRAMSRLFAPFTEVAAANPHAQFPTARTAEWLATPSAENYELADPFLKWHIAQDAVNQGAAVLLLSEERADALGIAPEKRVYLHGGGEASDGFVVHRPRLDGSWAMEAAVGRALDQAGLTAAELDAFDIYSCFPCAVFSACDALGLDWETDPRPLTLTGGLPFFGGPGNNYSMHGIASMVDWLRTHPGKRGLVLANGGWMTKESVGVYATDRPDTFAAVAPAATPQETVSLAEAPNRGILEAIRWSMAVADRNPGSHLGERRPASVSWQTPRRKRWKRSATRRTRLAGRSPCPRTIAGGTDSRLNGRACRRHWRMERGLHKPVQTWIGAGHLAHAGTREKETAP